MHQIDDVELILVREFLEKKMRFVRPRPGHRLIEIPLDKRMLLVVCRYEGEQTGKTKQRVIHWDHALLKSLPQPHHLSNDILNHIIAAAVVSMLGACATFAYKNWHLVGF